jgi:adenylate kinase
MPKRVILITGTPCVGKTSTAKALTLKLDALYINLTELATSENLIQEKDEQRNTLIVDEKRMKKRISKIIKESTKDDIIIDGHYAANVVSQEHVSYVFVLRRDPVELRKLMEQSGFSENKIWENLASEILDVCLVDTLNLHGTDKVCELDMSGKTVEESVKAMLDVLGGFKKCYVGAVDWLGKLEKEGILDQYLKS